MNAAISRCCSRLTRLKRFELLTPRFVVYTTALIRRDFSANRRLDQALRINTLAGWLQTALRNPRRGPYVRGSLSRALKPIEILRVTLSIGFDFEKLEVLIENLKTLLEPKASGHPVLESPGPRTG